MPHHAAQLREALPPHWAHEADRHAEFAHSVQHHPTARNVSGGGRMQACAHRRARASCMVPWRNGKRYPLHQTSEQRL